MADIKRIRDTTQKKMVWGTNSSGKVGQVWKIGEGFFVDNKGQWEEAAGVGQIYGPVWQDLPDGDSLGYYDTNVATNVYEPEPVEPVEPEPEEPKEGSEK